MLRWNPPTLIATDKGGSRLDRDHAAPGRGGSCGALIASRRNEKGDVDKVANGRGTAETGFQVESHRDLNIATTWGVQQGRIGAV